jgi:hypothetical protein
MSYFYSFRHVARLWESSFYATVLILRPPVPAKLGPLHLSRLYMTPLPYTLTHSGPLTCPWANSRLLTIPLLSLRL